MDYLDKITQDKSKLSQLIKVEIENGRLAKAGFFLDELYALHFKEYLYYCSMINRLNKTQCTCPINQDIHRLRDSKREFLIDFANKQLTGKILSQLPYKPL